MTDKFWSDQPVIPVVVINDAKRAVDLARTLVASGTKKIEITLRTPAALDAISRISAEVPDALVGAGTVVDLQTATRAVEAGAKFLVSPGSTNNLISALSGSGLPFLSGCSTLSEALDKAFTRRRRSAMADRVRMDEDAAVEEIAGQAQSVEDLWDRYDLFVSCDQELR